MIFLFLAAASTFILVYPYVIYPALLALLPRKPLNKDVRSPAAPPATALLFSAYNEQSTLPEKIRNLREIKAQFPDLEILAYSDGSNDDTAKILGNSDDILQLIVSQERTGKATGMRIMAEAASAEILICTDANVLIDPVSIKALLSYFEDPSVGCVAGSLRYVNASQSTTAEVGSAYWWLEEVIKKLESRTGSIVGADGSLFAVRAPLYPTVPPNLLDDMIVSMAPLFNGYRVIHASDVIAYERAATVRSDEFSRKKRIACRAFKTHLFLLPMLARLNALNSWKYVSHKIIRWSGALFMAMSAVFFTAGVASLFGMGWATGLAALYGAVIWAGLRFNIPIVSAIAEIIASIWATGSGVVEAIRGRDYTIWTPAKSRN